MINKKKNELKGEIIISFIVKNENKGTINNRGHCFKRYFSN